MCGILGFTGKLSKTTTKHLLKQIQHRGYDESITAYKQGVNLGMNRLAIQDLTKGYYPFVYKEYSLIYNGEIYNYPQLKRELEQVGVVFSTTCDAEVILPLFDLYGNAAFKKLEGMFAICILDEKQKKLLLIRDKTGEKPLYYCHDEQDLSFASEMKCLLSLTKHYLLNKKTLPDYLQHGSVSKGETLITGIHKLKAAHILEYDLTSNQLSISKYWHIPTTKPTAHSESDLTTKLESLIKTSVRSRLISDVPVGTFLSGGIDSSLITFYAQQQVKKINTYSIAFPDAGRHDESNYAETVANLIGTNHHSIPFTSQNARDIIANIGNLIDEPIVDPAFMPTLLLSQMARKKVKVVLTGEGADEVFGGYYRYYKYMGLQKMRTMIPFFSTLSHWNKLFVVGKVKRLFAKTMYYSPQSVWSKAEISKLLLTKPTVTDAMPVPTHDVLRTLELYDFDWYLAEQLLMKVDKATMQHNLEARAPFLDSQLISFGINLPQSYKLRGIHNKYLLRKLVERHISPDLAWRKKHGFSLPIEHWFRNDLKDIVEPALDFLIQECEGFNQEYINHIYSSHLKNEQNHANKIWSLLILSQWIKAKGIST